MRTYITTAGETWDIIAYNVYGSEFRMTELLRANPTLRAIVVFDAGVTVNLPEVVVPTATSLPPWKR